MTKLEQGYLVRYRAALTLHGYRGVALHRVAVFCLRMASASAYKVVAGSQRRSRDWKDEQLAAGHNAAIQQLRDMATKRQRAKAARSR
jgi:hypothetical protein